MNYHETSQIALLIPVYNAQEELERSIQSLPSDDEAVHIVVVDDGSVPRIEPPTPPDPHTLTLLRLDTNQGIEAALNYGLKWILEREFPYVARLDAGDVSLSGRFRKQKRFLEEHPECRLVGGQALIADPAGEVVARCHYPIDPGRIKRVMHYRNCFAHPAVMLRSEVFTTTGLYREDYPAAEDYELFWRVVRGSCAANLDTYVVQYVADPDGISLTRRRKQLLSGLRLMLHHFDFFAYESYIGIIKNLLLLLLPSSVNWAIKRNFCAKAGVSDLKVSEQDH